jgi:hypothetical protein
MKGGDIAFDEDEGCGEPGSGLPAESVVSITSISKRQAG